jgi:hypothetical protein
MKLGRETWLALVLLAVLGTITVAAAIRQGRGEAIPYLSSSSARDGTLAFKLWLDDLGYRVLEESPAYYQPPANSDLILILAPLTELTDNDLESLRAWVDQGGTLVLAGDSLPARSGFRSFVFFVRLLPTTSQPLPAETPLLSSPAQTDRAPVKADFTFNSNRTDFVTLLAVDAQPVMVAFEWGRGRVILSTTAYPFSNEGMKEKGNPALALNLVSAAARRGSIWFDEWHHGIQGNGIVGLDQWLRHTPAGHALLFVTLAVFLALLLQGRNFGRPVPLPNETRRRGPLEHVTAVANLNRKAGHRAAVLQQYHQQLKRHLGKRYRMDPALADAEYVEQLGAYNPALDRAQLLDLLSRLAQKNVGEAELVRLAGEASKWMKDR